MPSSQKFFPKIELCADPIFVIGSDRSGTTILVRSLSQHSVLWSSAETDYLFHLFGEGRASKAYRWAIKRPSGNWLKKENVSKPEFLEALGIGINCLFTSRSRGKRWMDHTPGYTMMVDMLADMFPGAYFLHMLRDGRRVVHSMINIMNTFKPDARQRMIDEGYVPGYVDFGTACRRWSLFVEKALNFESSHPDRVKTIRNEEITEDPERSFREIFDFIKVPYEKGPDEFFRHNRINSSFAKSSTDPSVREKLDPWQDWDAEQKRTFLELAGPTLVRSGFAKEGDLALSDYEQLVLRIKEVTSANLPENARFAVVNNGDLQLLKVGSRQGRPLPQNQEGDYSGGDPADSEEAQASVQLAKTQGADYILFPSTAYWWFEHYPGFKQYLDSRYSRLEIPSEDCIIFDLGNSSPHTRVDVPVANG